MTNSLKYLIFALALATAGSVVAHAHPKDPINKPTGPVSRPEPKAAPEVDVNLAFGGLTLLAGTLTVLRSRRSR